MHLGIIDGPFVPHNLISAQESPVPLPKFQMAPRLQILMSSGSRNGTQIHYPLLSKSLGKWISSPTRPLWRERYLLAGHFYISLDISLYIKVPKQRAAPMEIDTHSRALFNISCGEEIKVNTRSLCWKSLYILECHCNDVIGWPHSVLYFHRCTVGCDSLQLCKVYVTINLWMGVKGAVKSV
jgi:hypothetical protein